MRSVSLAPGTFVLRKFFFCLLFLNLALANSQANMWTAYNYSTTMSNVAPVYGSKGVPSPNNHPGTRQGSVSWTDNNGNLWLFGGWNLGFGSKCDLWKYEVNTNVWTWISGPDTAASPGNYGIMGVAAPSNHPSGRLRAAGWKDNAGNLWLYGGMSLYTDCDDLWKYNINTNEWTWMNGTVSGSNTAIYGSIGIPAPANSPGSRSDFVSGTDQAGNLWMFGGYGMTPQGSGPMSDLWKYNVATNEWTWIGGPTQVSVNGNYVQAGVPSSASWPGARQSAAGCSDGKGNLWVFGGNGYPQNFYGILSDLWSYNFNTGLWTWAAGPGLAGDPGTYGAYRVPSVNNSPPKRFFCTMQPDNFGNVWLFGGNDGTILNSTQTSTHSGCYNDLWRFDPLTAEWTWMSGSNTWDQPGNFNALGVPSAGNRPGARTIQSMWSHPTGSLWVFGGLGGISSPASSGWLADLWKYATCNPSSYSVLPTPSLTLNGREVICLGDSTVLYLSGASTYSLYTSQSSFPMPVTGNSILVSPSQNTTYTIMASGASGCASRAAWQMSVSPCLDMDHEMSGVVNVFPNPVAAKLQVRLPDGEPRLFRLYTVNGEMLLAQDGTDMQKELDFSVLRPGLYVLLITSDHDSYMYRIIKE